MDDEFEIYEPVGSASDTNADVRVSSIQLSVIRCLYAASRDEDWHRSSVFYTYVAIEDKSCKLIDGGCCVNVIFKTTVEKMCLKAEPHPQPYNVICVNKITQFVTQHCRVSIQMSSYQDRLWCNVMDMNGAHILLGRPWLYDLPVTSFGKSNTYEFKIMGRE